VSTLESLADDLKPLTASGHPPVHLWQPERQGEIDIVIKRDATHFGLINPLFQDKKYRWSEFAMEWWDV